MVKVTTSIKIDNDKRELAKRKGLILSDILDNALDYYLGIQEKESTQLIEDKKDLINLLEVLENEKNKFLMGIDHTKIKLENEKKETIKNYLQEYEDKLQHLEEEKQNYLNDYDTQVMDLNYKLSTIEEKLETSINKEKAETMEKEYQNLLNQGLRVGGIDDNDLMQNIEDYADKYEMDKKEFNNLLIRLENDIINNW